MVSLTKIDVATIFIISFMFGWIIGDLFKLIGRGRPKKHVCKCKEKGNAKNKENS